MIPVIQEVEKDLTYISTEDIKSILNLLSDLVSSAEAKIDCVYTIECLASEGIKFSNVLEKKNTDIRRAVNECKNATHQRCLRATKVR